MKTRQAIDGAHTGHHMMDDAICLMRDPGRMCQAEGRPLRLQGST